MDRGHNFRSFSKRNHLKIIYRFKVMTKFPKLSLRFLNHQNNAQNYYKTEELYCTYFKVSKTIFLAIFGLIEMKLC